MNDGLALTPPMGWNSWNAFGMDVDEAKIRGAADALVRQGLKAAGYEYVVVDDGWAGRRDGAGDLHPDPVRFPGGIPALADYVHSRGLKFGLYTDVGPKTCGGLAGSLGHEEQDAARFASWGVDYVKADWCHHEGLNARLIYGRWRDALKATGRPIVFSICCWGEQSPWHWGAETGHLWRTTLDVFPCWDCGDVHGNAGWPVQLEKNVGLEPYHGPGHWNDPDMLQCGNAGLTDGEGRAQFSMWCVLGAPLLAGNDLGGMSDFTRETLTNPEALAVNQDPLGAMGRLVWDMGGGAQVWAKALRAEGEFGAALFNRGDSPAEITLHWHDLRVRMAEMDVRDLWAHQDLGRFGGGFTATVAPHEARLLKVSAP